MSGSAGVVLAVGTTYDLWFLSIGAVSIFYYCLTQQAYISRFAVSLGFAYGFFAPFLWWMHVLGIDAYVLLVTLCSVLFTSIAVIPLSTVLWLRPLQFAALWTLVELVRSTIPWGGFPWGLVGYGQNSGPLVQYSRIGGSGAVAFIVCLVAACIVESVRTKTVLIGLIPIALVALPYLVRESATTQNVTVAAVQGSVPPTGLNDYVQRGIVLQRHISVTRDNKAELSKADLVVWPESAAGNDPINDLTTRNHIQQVVDEVGKPFLIGGTTWQGNPSAPRNVGLLWLPKIGPQHIYTKNHLVPFGEYVPWRSLLASNIKRFSKVPVDFVAGQGGGIFQSHGFTFGDAICFEVAYDDHISALVDAGAQFITAQSNNSTYLGTEQPEQQFQITRFRAVEHQRAVVVATTTGISGIISHDGKVLKVTQQNDGEVVQSRIELVRTRAFVDQFPFAFEFFSFGILLLVLIIRLRRSRAVS